MGADDHYLVVGAGELAHDVLRGHRFTDGVHGEAGVHRPRPQYLAQPGPVAAADPDAGDGPGHGVVGDVVVAGVRGVVGEGTDEGGGAGGHGRLHDGLPLAAEGDNLRGIGEGGIRVVPRCGQAGQHGVTGAKKGQLVQGDAALHALRRLGVEGDKAGLQAGGGGGVGQGEAGQVQHLHSARAVAPDGQGPAARLPVGQLHRLQPHVLQAEVTEALQAELLCPAVGGVARAADALGEDLLDPAVDPLLGRDQVIVGHIDLPVVLRSSCTRSRTSNCIAGATCVFTAARIAVAA